MKRTILLGLVLLVALSHPVRADIIVLLPDGSGDYPTIQAAIDDANNGDIIYLLPGTYTGDGNRDLDLLGKSICVQSVAPDLPAVVAATIIDCNGSQTDPHRAFYFDDDEDANAVVAGLTITNGYAVEGGGGIFLSGSDPTISYCTITDCFTTSHGAAILSRYSEPVIINCTFKDNSAGNYGGGIYSDVSGGFIENCTFTANSANFGGGLHTYPGGYPDFPYGGPLAIANCTFKDNSAGIYGGGIFSYGGIIENCTFTGNSANGGGGAISCFGDDVQIVDSTISYNSSVAGGAIISGGNSTLTITNSTISHNSSHHNGSPAEGGGGGGAIWSGGADMRINKCTINANKAAYDGGGIYCDRSTLGRVIITNTRISGNSAANNGGAIFTGHFDLTIISSWVTGNSALQSGGGVYTGPGGRMPEIINTTFADNWAQIFGGGIFGEDCGYPVTITNSILWGNQDYSGTGLLAQVRTCETQADAYAIFSCIQDDNPDDANVPFGADPNFNIDDDPCFVMRGFWADANDTNIPVGPNDPNAVWVDGDYHLLVNSPCIDAGSSTLLPPAKSVSTEIDDQPRVIGQDVDMGADEFGSVIIVNSPQEGDVWAGGSTHQINWYSYQTAGTVDISYSDSNGAAWVPIETALPDAGTYTWQVPISVDSTQSLVSVVPTIPEPNTIIIDSGLFTIHPDFVHPAVPSEWPSLAGGFDRSSLSDNIGPEVGCVKWQFQTDSPVISSVTAGPADRTHIACRDGKLYTLDSAGALLWTFDANRPFLSAPTVGPSGSIYVGTEDGILYAVSIAGTVRWTHRTGGFIWSSPAVSQDGTVYVCSADGRLYALASNGTLLWTFQTDARGADVEGSIFASPAIGPDGTVYIGGLFDPNLYALEPNDGTVKWACTFADPCNPSNPTGWPFVSPVLASDGTIYQTLLYDPNLYAIEPEDGNILWSTNLAAPNIPDFDYCYFLRPCEWRGSLYYRDYWWENYEWYSMYSEDYLQKYPYVDGWLEPALGPDGTIYVSLDEDPFLRAVDPNGTVRWVKNIGIMGGYTFAVGADGLLYVASDDGHLTVLAPEGEEIARFRGTGPLSFPVIPDYGKIIITDANNTVTQIGAYGCGGLPAALHRPEDLAGNWTVNNLDFALLADNWLECIELNLTPEYWDPSPVPSFYDGLPTYLQGDINRDLAVTMRDLELLTDRWLYAD